MKISKNVRTILQLTGIVVGFGTFAGVMYWLYVKRYDESHPVTLDEKQEIVSTLERVEVKIPASSEKPPLDALVRARKDQVDYSSISSGYSAGERITTETTNIVKDARGTDKGREAIDDAIPASGPAVLDIRSDSDDSDRLDDGTDADSGSDIPNMGDKKARLCDPEDIDYEAMVIDEVINPPEPKVISSAPFGKSQAELAMRFTVIDQFEYGNSGGYFPHRIVYYFTPERTLAGFNDDLTEVMDDDLLDMAYAMTEVKGISPAYVRDTIEGIDYKIERREERYQDAYEAWLVSRSD